MAKMILIYKIIKFLCCKKILKCLSFAHIKFHKSIAKKNKMYYNIKYDIMG